MLVTVGVDGVPHVLFAISDRPGLGFEVAATEAVEMWRYRPALKDGKPVETTIAVMVDFTVGPG
jgi:outer membrane biosynthesis protein TonB